MVPENFDVWQWLQDNALILALILSEIAAFLPTKAKGIIHFLVKMVRSLLEVKSSTTKNSIQ
jgi:hypothetical protein